MTVEQMTQGSAPASHKSHRRVSREKLLLPLAMLLPGIVVMLLVVAFPMLYSLYISFTDYTLTTASNVSFVGFENVVFFLCLSVSYLRFVY